MRGKSFEAAVRLNPQYMEAHDGLGFALEALHDDAGAIASYQKAIELNEASHAGFASPYVNLSALYNRTGDREAAMEYARKALEVNERSDRALFQLAKACEREERSGVRRRVAEPGHRHQPASVVLFLRACHCPAETRKDRREPAGDGRIQQTRT